MLREDKPTCCFHCNETLERYMNRTIEGYLVLSQPIQPKKIGFVKFVEIMYDDYKGPGLTHIDTMQLLRNAYDGLSDIQKNIFF